MTHPDTIKKEQLERILTEWSGKTISDNSHFVSELKKTVESAIDATREATLEEAEKELWEQSCKGCGHHDSIWKTLVSSLRWKEWYQHASENMLYDVDECQELGCMGKNHFEDFMKYFENKSREATLLEVEEVYYNKNPHHLSLAEIIKQMKNK